MAHDVFISYSHEDKAIADAVCHRIEAAGIRCWIAPRDIAHGKTWDDAVVEAVTTADLLVVIFSASANASRQVLNEVAAALNAGATVIPFRIEDIQPTGALLLHLGRVHWLDALSPPWEPHIDRLIESVSRNLPQRMEQHEGSSRHAESGPKQPPRPEHASTRRSRVTWWKIWPAAFATVLVLLGIGSGYRWWSHELQWEDSTRLIPKPSPQPPPMQIPPPRILAAHTGPVEIVAISPNGRTLASGSLDHSLKLWEVTSGKILATLMTDPPSSVEALAFTPNGRVLASAGDDQTIRLWDAESGKQIRTLKGHTGDIKSVDFSPDGHNLASVGSDDKSVRVWSATTGDLLFTFTGNTGSVEWVAFSHTGTELAAGLEDGSINIWDPATRQLIRTLVASNKGINAVVFSPNGEMLASASDDHMAKLWDLKSDQPLKTLEGHTDPVQAVAFSPDGRFVATGSEDRTIKLWDVGAGILLQTLDSGGAVNSVTFTPNGRTLVSGSDDDKVMLWDISALVKR